MLSLKTMIPCTCKRPIINKDTRQCALCCKYVKYLYRYEEVEYHPGVDEFDNPLRGHGRMEINCSKFRIIKCTPKGVWIDYGGTGKFVNLYARKKFACLDKHDALKSFLARKAKQITILENQLRRSKRAFEMGRAIGHKNFPAGFKMWLSSINGGGLCHFS